jgi:hypothetical protein
MEQRVGNNRLIANNYKRWSKDIAISRTQIKEVKGRKRGKEGDL